MKGLQGLPAQPGQGRQGREHLGAAIGQVVVGVEDAAGQLDQFALITQQQQAAHADLGRRHEQGSEPVARLEQKLRRQPQPGRQIEPVLTDHQHQIAAESRRCGAFAQSRKGLGQLVGAGAALHLSLGADQGQAIHHPKGGIAGALGQTPALWNHHLQLQTPSLRQQGPQVALEQLFGIGRHARLTTGLQHPNPFASPQLEPLAWPLQPAQLHP